MFLFVYLFSHADWFVPNLACFNALFVSSYGSMIVIGLFQYVLMFLHIPIPIMTMESLNYKIESLNNTLNHRIISFES